MIGFWWKLVILRHLCDQDVFLWITSFSYVFNSTQNIVSLPNRLDYLNLGLGLIINSEVRTAQFTSYRATELLTELPVPFNFIGENISFSKYWPQFKISQAFSR